MRLPGDVVFIVGGALPLLYLCYLGVRHTVPRITMEEPEDILLPRSSSRRQPNRGRGKVVSIHPEVFQATGYAVFLIGIGFGLDLLARHSHNRTERYRTAGFTYHQKSDAWICPEDRPLLRTEVDYERRLIRYRGRPQTCNRCPSKNDCTDSDEGREVVQTMNPWPHSEAGHFHRGISLYITLIAAPILAVVLVRNYALAEVLLLGTALAATGTASWHMHKAFRANPANFPATPVQPPATITPEILCTGYRKRKEGQR